MGGLFERISLQTTQPWHPALSRAYEPACDHFTRREITEKSRKTIHRDEAAGRERGHKHRTGITTDKTRAHSSTTGITRHRALNI